MATRASQKPAGRGRPDDRRRHRIRVLGALVEVCRGLERMQGPGGAREACRDVAAALLKLQRRELAAVAAKAGRGGRA